MIWRKNGTCGSGSGLCSGSRSRRKLRFFCGDPAQAYAALKRSLSEGRYDFDGESYIPEVSIEDFNRKYRTNYCTEEIGVDL